MELMIAVAIIGILAAVAIPLYRDYTTRAEISEGLALVGPLKSAVGEYYAIHGDLPTESNWYKVLEALGMPHGNEGAASGRYVTRIYWHNDADAPAIYIRYQGNDAIDGKKLALMADFDGDSLVWRCRPTESDGIDPRYLPASCKP
ncbi:pilin [Salinisphaera sp. Q1T1-3]|nr:pilin [Salinisphaera sp. Q1T1-3]